MGKIKQGILGGFSGKVGNIVGASWKGIDYIRSLPTTVANPRTPAQVSQRTKFTATSQFLQANSSFVNLGYKFLANGMTPRNAANSYLLKNAMTGTEVDPAAALLSRGRLQPAFGGAASAGAGSIGFTWNDNSTQGNASPGDLAMLLAYNPTKRESATLLEATTRDQTSFSLPVPAHFSGDAVEVYMAFQTADGKMVSDSVYLGSVTVS